MIAVDTNVLVRALVDDPGNPQQCGQARASLKQARQVYVPQLVQAEFVWVLETAMGLTKIEVLSVLDHLHDNAAFELQGRSQFEVALGAYRTGNADFADYLILAESQGRAIKLLSFDKRLLKSAGVESPSVRRSA